MAEKRFYWIKLKTDFFSLDEIDFLLSQKNGCEYVVLYQMLCLTTANNDGRLCTSMGEMIIPYDVNKIVRETKYFDADTVIVALELFKKLGLIFEQSDGVLKISAIEDMVGSETSSAKRVRDYRNKKALHCNKNVTQEIEYRDKSIENRDKNTDIEIDIDKRERISNTDVVVFDMQDKEIFDYWNSKNIIQHKNMTDSIVKAIQNCRKTKKLTNEDIKVAIDRYATMLNDTSYKLCSYKWGLVDFLKQSNAITEFLDNGTKWLNYNNSKKSNILNVGNKLMEIFENED